MDTLEILTKLHNAAIQHPDVLSGINPEDIITNACLELCNYELLYSESRWNSVIGELTGLCATLRDSYASNDPIRIIRSLSDLIKAFSLLPDPDHTVRFLEQSNFDHALVTHVKKGTTIVLGDSHVNVFSGNELLSFIPIGNGINTCPVQPAFEELFTPLHLGSCLAFNSSSYGSTNKFREKTDYLKEHFLSPGCRVICSLGEIDLRVHVCAQATKQDRTTFEIVDSIIEQYMDFLTSFQDYGYDLYVFGPIASQKDDCPIDPQYPHTGSEKERNIATEYFNRILQEKCRAQNIGFFTIFNKMVDHDHSTLEQYISSDRVHLGQTAMPLILEAFHAEEIRLNS